MNNFEETCVRCNGYELIHRRELEPPIDFQKPILQQRNYWFRSKFFLKPILSKIPLHWEVGFHHANGNIEVDENLYLIHLHRLDYNFCKKHTEEKSKYRTSKEIIEKVFGYQNRLINNEFEKWFTSMNGALGPIEKIPEKFNKIF